MKTYTDGKRQVNYGYNAENLRIYKIVNGKFTGYVWNGSSLAAETNDSTITNLYTYGADGITTAQINGTTNIYLKNVHGDIVGMTDTAGTIQKTYRYDAFGNEQNPDEADKNPFRYTGEYFDKETDNIYLRNRYYSPNIGRFITEDPIWDGLNWYAYVGNNPIMLIDPWGLFDFNTKLSKGSRGDDVRVLQNELKWLGYYDGEIDGNFGPATENAVNAYKNDANLGNTGEYRGVVGLQTWTSLGLIYREQKDIDAGVQIKTLGNTQFFDISKPVNDAVFNAKSEFSEHSGDLIWFRETVGDTGKWNIKRNSTTWASTLGISKNSYNTRMLFYGRFVTIDDVGNITYGYLGKAANLSDAILMAGSMGNHLKNHGFSDFDNEFSDEGYIQLGIDWYNGADIQVRFSAR